MTKTILSVLRASVVNPLYAPFKSLRDVLHHGEH